MSTEATVTAEAPDGLDNHPEFAEIRTACPPGGNPAPAKPVKAVSKMYFVTDVGVESVPADPIEDGGQHPAHGIAFIVPGSQNGFRTKEELAKFARTLPPGEYTVIAAMTKKLVVSDVRRVKGV